MTTPILQADGLTKSYGDKRVVDALSLSCPEGSVLGLLGPNGAGKTTTLRMLYGFIEPEAGQIRYDGRDLRLHRTELKRMIGVCTQEDSLDYDFSVRQNLFVYSRYFNPREPDIENRIKELLKRFSLEEYEHASPHTLSGGFKKRLLIARSIIHRPRVLFLDEPTTGLDPQARVELWELVDKMRKEGLAIVLTTHYMDEAERLSDDLVVLSEGKNIAHGAPAALVGKLVGEHVLVVSPAEPQRAAIEAWLIDHVQATSASVLGELRTPLTTEQLSRFTEHFSHAKLTVRPPNLDDLFLQLARKP